MKERSVEHATFTIERTYDAPPQRVFTAFADPAARIRWLSLDGMDTAEYELDFRVGGREFSRGGPAGGPTYTAEGRYANIVADERIVYAYAMDADGVPLSVSLTTVEFRPTDRGTRLTLTEQGAFLDGMDRPDHRSQGISAQLDNLAEQLGGER